MSKNPAFLFYSQDFYVGTRMMMPEERACYVDLLILQHQKGIITKDIDRLLLHCTGVDKGTLVGTLKGNFIETDEGYLNEKLAKVMDDYADYKDHQSIHGKVGVFFKRARKQLKATDYRDLRDSMDGRSNEEIHDLIKDIPYDKIKGYPYKTLKGTLIGSLKQLESESESESESIKVINKKESKIFNIQDLPWQVKELYTAIVPLFPERFRPSNKKATESWMKTIFTLHEKDGYAYEDIEKAVKYGREDDFWKGNFYSVNKLRTKNKEKVKYIDVFLDKMESVKSSGKGSKSASDSFMGQFTNKY